MSATSNALANARAFRPLSYVLLFLMTTGGVLTLGSFVQNVAPDAHPGILAAVLLLIVLDRLYTHRQLKSLPLLSREWLAAVGAQWIVLLLLARILLAYAGGFDSFRQELSLMVRGHIEILFTVEFVFTLLLALLVWYLTGLFLGLLDEIGLDPELALREESVPIQLEAVPAHQRLVNLIFGLGIVLVILTTLARLNLRSIVASPDGIPRLEWNRLSGGEAGALLFFAFGLALLSLSRLMSLQTHWNRLRIPVSSHNLTGQWGIYSLVFLLALALVVSLLPAGDSLGLISVIGTLFAFLFHVLVFLAELLVGLILLLFSLPFLLLGKGPPTIDRSAPPPLPTLPPAGAVLPSGGNALWELIRSTLLWGSLIVIVVFSLVHFVRQHEGLAMALRRAPVINWLVLAWQWLYRNADRTRKTLATALAEGWQRLVSRLEGRHILPRPGLISLRSLDPRRQIYFFYLAMVRRGAEHGLPRRSSQTPSEYALTLEKALPSAGEDIEALTAAFVEARYSRRDVDERQVGFVRATWARIRRLLRSRPGGE